MKRLLSSISRSALIIFLTATIAQAMDAEEQKREHQLTGQKRKRTSSSDSEEPNPQKIKTELVDFYPASIHPQQSNNLTFHTIFTSRIASNPLYCGDEDCLWYWPWTCPACWSTYQDFENYDSDRDRDIGGEPWSFQPIDCFLGDLLPLQVYDFFPKKGWYRQPLPKIPELTMKIVQLLPYKDQLNLRLVNQKFKRIADFAIEEWSLPKKDREDLITSGTTYYAGAAGKRKYGKAKNLEFIEYPSPYLEYLNFNNHPHLTQLNLRSNVDFDAGTLRFLPNLKILKAAGNYYVIDDDIIRELTNLTDLRVNARVTDDGLLNLMNLKSLSINDLITDKSLTRLTQLTHLDISSNFCVTNQTLSALSANLRSFTLHSLDFGGRFVQITDDGLSQLSNLTKLDWFDEDTRWDATDRVTAHSLSLLTNLTDLKLGQVSVFYHNPNILQDLTNLTSLALNDCYAPQEFDFSPLKNLKKLYLEDMSDYTLDLSPLTTLTKLRFKSASIREHSLAALSNLTSLTALSDCTEMNIDHAIKNLTNLQKLVMYGCIQKDPIDALQHLRVVKFLGDQDSNFEKWLNHPPLEELYMDDELKNMMCLAHTLFSQIKDNSKHCTPAVKGEYHKILFWNALGRQDRSIRDERLKDQETLTNYIKEIFEYPLETKEALMALTVKEQESNGKVDLDFFGVPEGEMRINKTIQKILLSMADKSNIKIKIRPVTQYYGGW